MAPVEFNPFAWMTAAGPVAAIPEHVRLRQVGPEYTLGIAIPGTKFRLNGGLEVSYSKIPMRPGDIIRSVTRLVDLSRASWSAGAHVVQHHGE